MFDANLRHLPKGHKFFASIEYINVDGIDVGDNVLVLCEMLSEESINPKIEFKANGSTYRLKHKDHFEEVLMVYQGNVDGTGFIDKYVKAHVLTILGGEWL
jgi:hypothetical protein